MRVRRASVYRSAAGGAPPTEPKLPCPSTSGARMAKGCARRTNASYTARFPCGWYLPMTSPTMRAHLRVAPPGRRPLCLMAERSVEVRPLHLLFYVDWLNVEGAGTSVASAGRRGQGEFWVLIVRHESQVSSVRSHYQENA